MNWLFKDMTVEEATYLPPKEQWRTIAFSWLNEDYRRKEPCKLTVVTAYGVTYTIGGPQAEAEFRLRVPEAEDTFKDER